ncbi:unnamed protein product [Albugo candida]|uniref:BSD domain-containing protein n=1 Tax=Albugo candida TaxID=65357 RepID=A0A024FZ08_9STRA|nr:unnamed protein product [Albugo candida]|eukprot:CCI39533.1 unnamed protein product [Albugo candida]
MTAENGNLTATVRIKQRDGIAEFASACFKWIPIDPSTSHSQQSNQILVPWAHVQDQQVSSITSPKAMIRLRLTTNATLVMEFISDKGLQEAFQTREKAKTFIVHALARAGRGPSLASDQSLHRALLGNSLEIKQRAALLASDTNLKRQHTEMVNQGLISEEDFWQARRHLLANEASKRQKTGKTSSLLTDLAGKNESGGNVVKYNLNAEVIHQIFVQYPSIHLAYQDQVPDKLSETEFWSAFFKSKYFHRDRKAGHEDLFTKYEEKEQEMGKLATVCGPVDPLIDLVTTAKDQTIQLFSREEHEKDGKMTIAKFNRHSAYVLDPSHATPLAPQSESHQAPVKPVFHDNIQEAVLLDDLRDNKSPAYDPLRLDDVSRYFMRNSATAQKQTSPKRLLHAQTQFQEACKRPFILERAFPSSSIALEIVNEVVSRSTNESMDTNGDQVLAKGALAADLIPNDFKKQVITQFHDVCELLRHFLAFKNKAANSDDHQIAQKLERIVEKMGSKYDELVKIREALPPHEKNLLAPLLKPFDDQLNLAFI